MRNRDIERQIRDAGEHAGERVRHYADDAATRARSFADDAAGRARGFFDRGRRFGERLGSRNQQYGQQLSRKAEDLADEANYQYRRLRRHVNRHPVATVAIVAGTVGAFMLLRRAFRSYNED